MALTWARKFSAGAPVLTPRRTLIMLTLAVLFLVNFAKVHGRGLQTTHGSCTNETVYLSNDGRVYDACCAILYPHTSCKLAYPCRNGGVRSRDGARCECNPGWTGASCLTPCPQGSWGQGCNKRCRCGQGAHCDPMTGTCVCLDANRCVSRCRRNYWGATCQNRCRCKNDCSCDHDTGECLCRSRQARNRLSSPANMYFATLTQADACGGQCENGGTCRAATGTCRCRHGYIGDFCEHSCPRGRYGKNCQQVCQCSSSATCLPESGLCFCPGFTTSMFHCTGRCPVGRYGPYCGQTCDCPAGLLCNDVSGNCECPEGEVCTETGTGAGAGTGSGTDGTATRTDNVLTAPPARGQPVTVAPARDSGRRGGSKPAVADTDTTTNTNTNNKDAASSSSSSSSSSGGKIDVAGPGTGIGTATGTGRATATGTATGTAMGTGTSKASAPEIALQGGGDPAPPEERMGRGEIMTLWAVIAVSSLLLLVVASVLIGLLIKKQQQPRTIQPEISHKQRLEDTNVYEIVESTNGRYRSSSKTLDKLAKKARERAESINARDSISSITKEIYLLRTSSLSNMTTLNAPQKDPQATELFANWANSLRHNKSNDSLDKVGGVSPMSSRSRSNSSVSYSGKVILDNDFDDYAEPVDQVSTLSKDIHTNRPLTMTNSDSKGSDHGYQSLYTSSGSNPSSNRTSAVYKPTEDSDYDELEEDTVGSDRQKQFKFTRSYTYSTPTKTPATEYSFLNRGANSGNRLGPTHQPVRGNTGYSNAVKRAETDGEYSHLNRPKTPGQIPSLRIKAPTLRHDEEDDYDYLEAAGTQHVSAGAAKGKGDVKKSGLQKPGNKKTSSGDYDKLHRQFKVHTDPYESIWPGKK